MSFLAPLRWTARKALDFALPPRCAGCGAITAEVGLFCAGCWTKVEFMRSAVDGCERCGGALGPDDRCAACPEGRQQIDRLRAAVVYGDVPGAWRSASVTGARRHWPAPWRGICGGPCPS